MKINEVKLGNDVKQIEEYNNCVEKVGTIIAEEVNKYNSRIEELEKEKEKGEDNGEC